MSKIKVFATIAAVSALMFAGTLPASAHTGDAAPVVVCQTDGTYTVTWTYKQTNTPSSGQGSQSDVKVISHSAGTLASAADNKVSAPQIFLNEAVDHAANNKSNQHRLGNFEQTFTQSGIPGTATSASVGIQTDWLGWGATETDRTVTLPGDCKPPVVVPEKPAPEVVTTSRTELLCEVQKVNVYTTTTTTDWVLVDNVYVKTTPVVVEEVAHRDATPEECPPVVTPPVVTPPVVEPPVVNPPDTSPPATEPPATNPPVDDEPAPSPTPSETPPAAPETPQEPEQAPPAQETEQLAHTGIDATPFLLGAGALLLVGAVLLRLRKRKKEVA